MQNDDVDKMTQCWNNLKVTALSKAIAIAPDVGVCTIGPKSDDTNCEKLDLSSAVTSTPLKPQTFARNDNMNISFCSSQLKKSFHKTMLEDEESSKLESLRVMCLDKIEAYILNHVQVRVFNTSIVQGDWKVNFTSSKLFTI